MKPGLRTGTEAMLRYPGWRDKYRVDWTAAHGQPTEVRRLPFWARGDAGIDAFVTDTPEWDRKWFKAHKMPLPRFVSGAETYWRDYGDGLHGVSVAGRVEG
jgi:hypothetical protein